MPSGINLAFARLSRSDWQVGYVLLTRAPVAIRIPLPEPYAAPRLACVKPVASVHPEPGSNSSLYISISFVPYARNRSYLLIDVGFIPSKRPLLPRPFGSCTTCLFFIISSFSTPLQELIDVGFIPSKQSLLSRPFGSCTTCLFFIISSFSAPLQEAFLIESGCKGRAFVRSLQTFSPHFFEKFLAHLDNIL